MTADQFIFRARSWKAVCHAADDFAEDQGQLAAEPAPKPPTKKATALHSPSLQEGNRQSGLRHNLGAWLATAPDEVITSEAALAYAEVLRNGMNPRPDQREWNDWKPGNLCKSLVAREQRQREGR